jgi:hypothetical protein
LKAFNPIELGRKKPKISDKTLKGVDQKTLIWHAMKDVNGALTPRVPVESNGGLTDTKPLIGLVRRR